MPLILLLIPDQKLKISQFSFTQLMLSVFGPLVPDQMLTIFVPLNRLDFIII